MKEIKEKDIPNFENICFFAHWYINRGLPVLPNVGREVYVTDDATSTSLFRHGRYQVEMYMIHPNPVIPEHEHPGVKNIEFVYSSFEQFLKLQVEDFEQHVMKDGQTHGNTIKYRSNVSGLILLSLQEWNDDLTVSTISSRWKGHTAGEKHDALIRRFNPDCFMYPGYADVTRKNQKVEIL